MDIRQFVLTNRNQVALAYGCFDILHFGHINFFREIKKRTTLPLCIGVLPDFVVSNLKGQGRPLVNEIQRVEIVNALKFVDYAFLLQKSDQIDSLKKKYSLTNEDIPLWSTAISWLEIIRPKEFYYSSDFHMSTNISNYFSDNEIHSIKIPYTKEISTSDIVKRIVALGISESK